MKLIFDTHGNEKQKEVCRHWIDKTVWDIVYGGSKGSGKSFLGCSLIFNDALTYPGTHYFIARKTLNDLRKYTIPSIYEVLGIWGIGPEYYNFNATDNVFTLHNGSKVFLIAAKFMPQDPLYMRFGSMQMTRGWIEEAGEFEVAAKNNLAASVGRWKNDEYNLPGKLLMTCNPAKNFLYPEYYKKSKDGKLEPHKRFVQALPTDNKKLASGYLEHLRRTLTKNEKIRLLEGNWEYDDDPATMLDYEAICNIFTNNFVKGGKKYITADIARFGKDKTIIRVWDGWRVIQRVVLMKARVTQSAEMIKQLAQQFAVPRSNIIVDEDGIGGGVVDLIIGCVGFIANNSPINDKSTENYKNLKTQCAFKLAEKINNNEVYEEATDEVREILTQDLEQVKQKNWDKENAPKEIVPKDDIKKLIDRSPDDGDTYIMRAYFDIKGKAKIIVT